MGGGISLLRVYKTGKQQWVSNEKDGSVVSNQVLESTSIIKIVTYCSTELTLAVNSTVLQTNREIAQSHERILTIFKCVHMYHTQLPSSV